MRALRELQAVDPAPFRDLAATRRPHPWCPRARGLVRVPRGQQRRQHNAGIADDGDVHMRTFLLMEDGSISTWILVESRAERVQPSRHAVVEPRADVQHHVAAVHGAVGLERAVHPEHAQELRIVARDRPRGPSACEVQGKPVLRTKRWSAPPPASGPALMTPPPEIHDQAACAPFQRRHGARDLRRVRMRRRAIAAVGGLRNTLHSASCRSGCPSADRSPPAPAGRCGRRRTPRAPRGRGLPTA